MLVHNENAENAYKVFAARCQSSNESFELDNDAIERDAAAEEDGVEKGTWPDAAEEGEGDNGTKGRSKRLLLLDGSNLNVQDLVDCVEDRCELQVPLMAEMGGSGILMDGTCSCPTRHGSESWRRANS